MHTAELALLRCIRPDLVQQCLHSLVSTVYDFEYSSFEMNVLTKFIDPNGTLDLRRNKGKFDVFAAKEQGIAMPEKKKSDNSLQLLISEAVEESNNVTPILFLISHSVNVQQELTEFHVQFCKTPSQAVKLYAHSCGKLVQ